MASGGGKGRIPWTDLNLAQGEYIADEYLPEGVTLTQYHHIRLGDANALLQHWTTRQAAGEIGCRFKKVDKTSRQSRGDVSPGEHQGGIKKVQGDEDSASSEEKSSGDEAAADPGPSNVSDLPRDS